MAYKSNKPLAQSLTNISNDTLIHYINQSKKYTSFINPQIKILAKANDLVIAFATLNYAWTRKGTFYVLANKNKEWKLYSYEVKLPVSSTDTATAMSSINISAADAENIKRLYVSSRLWNTNGDENGAFCNDKKDFNITDAETWMISVATPQNIHTTTYYAPEYFDQCCPGNPYRQRFVAIAKGILKLSKTETAQ